MSNISYDFLTESILFLEANNLYEGYNLEQLNYEIEKYREYIDKNLINLDTEIGCSKKENNMLSNINFMTDLPSNDELLRGSLFLNKYVIDDPIYSFKTIEQLEILNLYRQMTNYPKLKIKDVKRHLAECALYMKELRIGVRSDIGYIKFYPLAKKLITNDPRKIRVPDLSIDHIKKDLFEWFLEQLIVQEIRGQDFCELTKPCNHIALYFDGDDTAIMPRFHTSSVSNIDKRINKWDHIQYDVIPPEKQFAEWLDQEKKKAIIERLDQIYIKYELAQKFNAPFYTKSNLEKEFIEHNFGYKLDKNINRIGFNLKLPSLENSTLERAMEIRLKSYTLFENFQEELMTDSLKLSNITTEAEFNKIMHELNELYSFKVGKIKSKISKIPQVDLSDAISLSIAGFSYFTMPKPFSNIVTGLSLMGLMYNKFSAHKKECYSNPFYLFHKL